MPSYFALFKFLQGLPEGSVLFGAISYGKLSYFGQGARRNPEKNPASNQISYIVPPRKVEEMNPSFSFITISNSFKENIFVHSLLCCFIQ